MANPSGDKGTKWAKAVAEYLDAQLPVTVERRVQHGANDLGDISGIEGVVIEAFNQKRMDLGTKMAEAEREADRDGGSLPICFHKRRGQGHPASNYVTMPGWAFVELLKGWMRSEAITTARAPKGFTGSWG